MKHHAFAPGVIDTHRPSARHGYGVALAIVIGIAGAALLVRWWSS